MEKIKNGISAIIISRNEEARIQACLESLSWASELIVVDNSSIDSTVSISKKFNAYVISSDTHDFSKLREFGISKVHYKWIVYVDADETVSSDLQDEIIKLISYPESSAVKSAYYIYRKNFYLGHEWPYRDKMIRLFQKEALLGWTGKLHETANVNGSIGHLVHPLIHNTHRTLEDMIKKTNDWSNIEAKLRFANNHPKIVPWRLLRVMFTGFYESFIKQGGWKVGVVGWIESMFQAYSIFITYAKLWELQENSSKRVSQ